MATSPEATPAARRNRILKGWRWKAVLIAVVVLGGAALIRGNADGRQTATATANVMRGHLPITVLVQGASEAIRSQDIRSQVKGRTTIMSIVEEGYLVTQEDVDRGKILVELNDSELQNKLTQQEIAVQNAFAQHTNAREEYEIQVKQNESDIMAAELDSKFKRMDFERYLGQALASKLIDDLGLNALEQEAHVDIGVLYAEIRQQADALGAGRPDVEESLGDAADEPGALTPEQMAQLPEAMRERLEQLPAEERAQLVEQFRSRGEGRPRSDGPGQSSPPAPEGAAPPPPNTRPNGGSNGGTAGSSMIELSLQSASASRPDVDFSQYATPERLTDGEAEQRLRQLEDELLIARNELTQAETQLDGTRRLAERGFVTKNELDRDETSRERSAIRVQSAETSRQLFLKYEFPKQAEKLLSDYEESLRRLVRTKKQAISKLSQAETKLLSQRVQLDLQVSQRDDLLEQIANCRIPAERVGFVVYGGSRSRSPMGQQTVIEVGAEITEGFDILTIPDMTEMAVRANVSEADITKIQRGQQARVRLEAFPDRELVGRVGRVSPLPDSGGRWGSDEKLYPVSILIEGTHEWLMPGMTAEVQIIVAELDDVVYVPLQAVTGEGDQRAVHVLDRLGKAQRRPVTTGQFNDVFVQIVEGLEPGEQVLLVVPNRSVEGEAPGKTEPVPAESQA